MLPNNQKFYRPYERYSDDKIQAPQFKPYQSDSDSESDAPSDYESGSVTTTTSSKENLPNFVEFATNLELNETGGQNLPTTESQLKYGINELRRDTNYASYKQAFDIELPFDSKQFDVSGTEIFKDPNPRPKQPTTSIVMLNSRDRDRNVYPTPANLSLRLPRVYQNITSMQVVQMKLLSSFLYFRLDKSNTSITINEFGRIFYNYLNQALGPLNVTKYIREGTYNINSLITELNTQLNTPPLFYDYPGGFNQFVPLFVATGDFGLAFNYPGDYYYDSLNGTFTAAPTRSFITLRFWPTTTLGFTPTLKQVKVAYYYPVLKEYVLDPLYGINKLNTDINTSYLLPDETIYTRIVYAFQGVNDPIVQQMIDVNVVALDQYRSAHTFRQSLINRYVVSYDTFNLRINIQSPSLNTSLVNLLNAQYQIFLTQQLTNFGLTQTQYALLQTLNSQLLSVVNAMYDYIQTQLAIYFGINFNTFAPIYFTQANNYINIQNALNAIGISSNYDAAVIRNPNDPFRSNIIEINRQDPIVFWPNMSNLPLSTGLGLLGYPTNLGESNQPPFLLGSNHPYEISTDEFNFDNPFIDADGDVYIDLRRKAGDIICPIQAGRYTVFRFRSLYRQTLQVETMPRPTQYRYPAYNAVNYGSNIVSVFDNSYSFVFNTFNSNMDNVPFASLCNIYGFGSSNLGTSNNFGIDLTSSKALWTSNTIPLDVRSNAFNFVFYLPNTPTPPDANTPAFKHRMALTVTNVPLSTSVGSNIPAPLKLFLYQDRAAFMADLSGNARNENDYHYKQVYTIGTTDISATFIWNAYAGQPYYCILRSANISFQTMQATLAAWYPDGPTGYYGVSSSLTNFNPFADPYSGSNLSNWNYAQVDDPDFIKLPIQSNLWGINPRGNEVNQGLVISNVPIGYDTNGVSTDLTDYMGFIANQAKSNVQPNALIRADPISGYFFQAGSPYNQTTQSYFYSNANNFILTPFTQSNYVPSNVPYRQYKIVQWYDTTYLPDPAGFVNPFNTLLDVTSNITPYRLSNTGGNPISNYDYDIGNGNIQLGLGPSGFSFVPSDGLWTVDKILFRSAFIQNDPNDNIAYLGVFLTNVANTTPTYRLALSSAVAKLDFNSKVVYSNTGSINFGFDGTLGTYYTFTKDSTFISPLHPSSIITGFDQNAATFNSNHTNFYSVVPFDANSNVTYTRALTGSLVPYPYVTDASAARYYYDGNQAPNRKGIVVASNAPPAGSIFGPPTGVSYTQSAYEQSLPIGTQITHYLGQPELVQDLSGFVPWSGPGYAPTQICADVSGVMMIQSSDFKFYSYPYNTTTRIFTYLFNLTVDNIYPAIEATTLVAVAGNSTSYAFLGFQVVGGAYQVRIKVYNVGSGILSDLSVPAQFQIPDLGFAVNTFCITDTLGFSISGQSGGGLATTYRTPTLASPSFFVDTYAGYTTVKTIQPPTSDTLYSLPFFNTGLSSNVYYSVNELLDSTIGTNKKSYTITTSPTIPSFYNNICVTRLPGIGDEVLFLSPANLAPTLLNAPSRFYRVRQLFGSDPNFTARVEYSDLVFESAPPQNPVVPLNMVGGALGSKWAFFNQPYYIWGNRNDQEDAPILVQNAWQIFYPNIKVVLRKLANAVNPITDLTGLQYPEYPHTQMFCYNTLNAFKNDISNNTNPKWGFETSGGLLPTNSFNLNSNGFLVSDVNFSGFYFNSYIFNVPLLPNTSNSPGGSNPEPYYYLVVRNYAPSEKSQVLLRFNLPQRYDFGFVRIRDLSNEPIFASTNQDLFNPSYFTALSGFNSNFVFSNVNFGYNPQQNIPGSNITSAGFGDFVNQYTRLFNLYNSNVVAINTITSNVNANMLTFIQDNLIYLLPSYALTRTNYTEAIQFSILWRSALTPTYLKLEDEWGLGWNLGYAKRDTPYATIARAESFFKILDDYIYLKLNPEYDMNRMDFGGKENLKQTNEPTGSILGYNGKLLLNTFGNYAQTIIQNPVYFNPPLLKLDKLTFQWYDTAGTLITNTECEWNAAIQLVEEQNKPDVRGKNPIIIPMPTKAPNPQDFPNTTQNVRFFPS